VVLQLYSETLQKFRLAAQGHGPHQPPDAHRERVATYFDPLPLWYEPFESSQVEGGAHGHSRQPTRSGSRMAPTRPPPLAGGEAARLRTTGPRADERQPAPPAGRTGWGGGHPYPLHAVTQRPMFMYHAWGSHNAWLRQIATRNWLYLHPDTGARFGVADGDWVEVASHHGMITVQARFAANVQPDTVWTWNAIGKRRGAWQLDRDAPEGRKGFLLNHLIGDLTPRGDYANADPVTGQAAWFDLRVSIRPAAAAGEVAPQPPPLAGVHAGDTPLRYGARMRAREHG
jgi:sulfite dehydrogenase (quinone) subunit SoeA